jgi:GH25 family lysozyme M1 (1,4-beta-N-acetylmuramidase)
MAGFIFADISSNNHEDDKAIDFSKAHVLGGVVVKATEGVNYVNPYLTEDATAIHKAGKHIGYYHYARPSESSGQEQASFILDHVSSLPRDLGISLDLEVTEGVADLSGWAKEFLDTIAARKIGSPLYSNAAFLELMPQAPFGHKLWYSAPGTTAPKRKVWAWQFSWTASVSGFSSAVDLSHYYG